MNRIMSMLILVFMAVGLSSCHKESKVLDQTLEVEFEHEANVSEEEPVSMPMEEEKGYDAFKEHAIVAIESSDFGQVYQAEKGILSKVDVKVTRDGYSGEGYIGVFDDEDASATMFIEISSAGFYDLTILAASPYGDKVNYLTVNDQATIDIVTPNQEAFVPIQLQRVYLEQGLNKFQFTRSWGWYYVDSLHIKVSEPMDLTRYEVEPTLINPNATLATKRLMQFITDNYGKNIIVGQHSDKGFDSQEIRAIYEITNKYPALIELDFIEYSPSRQEKGSRSNATELAISFAKEQKGIVAFCWHWNAPKDLMNTTGHEWWRGFYTDSVTFDFTKSLNGEDEEGYQLLLRDIDVIAEQLKILQAEDIPILFRPLHEASGGWFWWGAKGPEPFIELYRLVYDRITNYHGINNLIWVWNGQAKEWYPGDNYVDIISEDIYPPARDYSSQSKRFFDALDYTKMNKVIALSENGVVPDVDILFRDNIIWSWFATWQGSPFVLEEGTGKYSEEQTEIEILKKIYHSDRAITLDKLPDLSEYGK